jgi:hypothetical protein
MIDCLMRIQTNKLEAQLIFNSIFTSLNSVVIVFIFFTTERWFKAELCSFALLFFVPLRVLVS